MSKKVRKRHFLRDKDAKALLDQAGEELKVNLEKFFSSQIKVERFETDFGEVFMINGKPSLFKKGEKLYPTLVFEEIFASTPKVVVDMGAVRRICNGANVMAPGIVRFEGSFGKGDLVFIVDEKHGKPIAVGEILYGDAEAVSIKQGVVVGNVHFVGDRIWRSIKELA